MRLLLPQTSGNEGEQDEPACERHNGPAAVVRAFMSLRDHVFNRGDGQSTGGEGQRRHLKKAGPKLR